MRVAFRPPSQEGALRIPRLWGRRHRSNLKRWVRTGEGVSRFTHGHVPGRTQILGSARVALWSRVLGPSESGLLFLTSGFRCFDLFSGNGTAPLRTMRSRALTILLLIPTRTTAKRCTVAFDTSIISDNSDRWGENMSYTLFCGMRIIRREPSSSCFWRGLAALLVPLLKAPSCGPSGWQGLAFERTETASLFGSTSSSTSALAPFPQGIQAL